MYNGIEKMRDSLQSFVDSVEWLCEGDESGKLKKQFSVILAYAREGLAYQPRNCDIGTAEEQNERFKQYCATHRLDDGPGSYCMRCPLGAQQNSYVMCQFLWSQLPYNEVESKE